MSIEGFKVNGSTVKYNYTALDNKPTIPAKTSDLTNDSGFVNASGAAAAAPVQSVNGQTGAVTVSPASDDQVSTAVNTWCGNNVAQETGYVLDSTLTMSNAAAPADKVGELKSAVFSQAHMALEEGDLEAAQGYPAVNANRLRTKYFYTNSIASLKFNSGCLCKVFGYSADGTFLGCYDGSAYSKNWQTQVSFEYFVDVKGFFKTSGASYFKFVFRKSNGSKLTEQDLGLLVEQDNIVVAQDFGGEVYRVGASGDFATFTAMLRALKNNVNKKTVYVEAGEYDIFEEIGGAAYMASLDTTGKGWVDVSDIVSPNTTIIGVGNVTLTWNPTNSEIVDQAHAFLFSPLNLRGSCEIRNINIDCSNCRYGIHSETSGLEMFNDTTQILENVTVTRRNTSIISQYAYGAGHNEGSKRFFKNCVFSADITPWSTHDWSISKSGNDSHFVFDHCVFKNNNGDISGLYFITGINTDHLDKVDILSSEFNSIVLGTNGTTTLPQRYDITEIGCHDVNLTYGQYIDQDNRIPVKKYLTIPTS